MLEIVGDSRIPVGPVEAKGRRATGVCKYSRAVDYDVTSGRVFQDSSAAVANFVFVRVLVKYVVATDGKTQTIVHGIFGAKVSNYNRIIVLRTAIVYGLFTKAIKSKIYLEII